MMGIDIRKLFRGRTPAAQGALTRFLETYQTYIDVTNTIALSILVWGPGLNSNTRVANKRRDIHAALLQQGHNAMFSEELVADESHREDEQNALKTLELAQAAAADLIIILLGEGAMGVLAEAEDFGNHPDVVSKIYVLAPRSYKEGYVGRGTLWLVEKGYGGVYWYDDPEIESCNVLTEALIRVQARRQIEANFTRLRNGGQV